MSRISDDDLTDLIDTQLPWVRAMGMSVEAIGEGTCRVRLPHRNEHLRPGGTVSGPARAETCRPSASRSGNRILVVHPSCVASDSRRTRSSSSISAIVEDAS